MSHDHPGEMRRIVLRTSHLADLFGVQRRTISRWIASGRLPLTGDPLTDFHWLASRPTRTRADGSVLLTLDAPRRSG